MPTSLVSVYASFAVQAALSALLVAVLLALYSHYRHRYLVEFAAGRPDLGRFAAELDAVLCRDNEDYAAHRQGDLTMLPPEVVAVPRGGFAGWMKSRGKLGGQNKVPRMDNSGQITRGLVEWLDGAAK